METFEGTLKSMKWLVTGAGGQLGRALSAQMAFEGLDFVALESKDLDITNSNQVNDVINTIKPQVIINTAAWTDVEAAESNISKAFQVNSMGARNLALSSMVAKSILIHISTDYVFSGKSRTPWAENAQTNPDGVYGLSKASGEVAVRTIYPQGAYVLRTSWLYSEYKSNFVKMMCALAILSEDTVEVVGDQIGQPTSAHDLANQILAVSKSSATFGIYHATNAGCTTWFDLAREVFIYCGQDPDRVLRIESTKFRSLVKRPSYSVLSHEMWKDSGVAPLRDWREALIECLPHIVNSVKGVS